MKHLDLMLDLETYGKGPLAAIAQISAVPFSRTRDLNTIIPFNSFISLAENEKRGLKADDDTLAWWASQDEAAIKMVIERAHASTTTLEEALYAFSSYINQLKATYNVDSVLVWGNGSVFDNRILSTAYNMCGIPVPWKYNADRDLRTLIDVGESIGLYPKKLPFVGMQHNAIDDCLHQIKQVLFVYRFLESPGE